MDAMKSERDPATVDKAITREILLQWLKQEKQLFGNSERLLFCYNAGSERLRADGSLVEFCSSFFLFAPAIMSAKDCFGSPFANL